jgi:hypothetical protein
MAQPMHRHSRIHSCSFGRGFHDVVDAPIGQGEHPGRRLLTGPHGQQQLGEMGRNQNVPGLVALADDGELHFPRLPGQHLAPRESGEFRNP